MRFILGRSAAHWLNQRSVVSILPAGVVWRIIIVAVTSVVLLGFTDALQPATAADLLFRRPTSAPVLDPFRLPDGKYGAGNRGIEYDTGEFDRIVAAARGTVVFAGPVARSLFVTVDHGNGLESSYGFVGHILVREGEDVVDGDLVALADGPFHFSVRLHGEYVDPERLFGARRVVVRLVSHPVQGPRSVPTRSVVRGLALSAATLPRGSTSLGRHQIDVDEQASTRVTPGRFGARHGFLTGKKEQTWL